MQESKATNPDLQHGSGVEAAAVVAKMGNVENTEA